MVTQFGKCLFLCALTARRSVADLYKTRLSWHVVRHSSSQYETKISSQHLPTNKWQQKQLVGKQPESTEGQRLLKVAIIGAPNAGKSTLLNKLIGWKVAPVSQKVHTTRCKTLGVLTEDEKQVIFLDTPGIIVPGKLKRHKLETSLLVDPHIAMFNADIVLVIVDISHIWHRSRLDPEILKLLHLHADKPSVLVLNKVDRVKKKGSLLSVVRKLTEGVVADRVDWSVEKPPRNVADIFRQTTGESGPADAVSGQTVPYSLQETCQLLQTSYDDMCADDEHGSDCEDIDSNAEALDGSLSQSSTPDCNTRLSDIKPADSVTLDDKMAESITDHSEQFDLNEKTDLYRPDVWESYYGRLRELGRALKDREGWPHFSTVFLISATDDDGTVDIRNYLLDSTYLSGWVYSSSVVTDQNPMKLAKSIISERLLDHLPDEVPYSIQVKLSLWTVENGYLRASFDIVCSQNRQMRLVLRHIRAIAAETKQQLMNAFRREMTLKLAAVSLDKSSPNIMRELRRKKEAALQQQPAGPKRTGNQLRRMKHKH